jgi:predicted nucleic acid-binding protein
VILVDTGPFVALFDPGDDAHTRTRRQLQDMRGPLVTTTPVLTEAFHLLDPASRGASALRTFLRRDGVAVWFLDGGSLRRALELMDRYADRPMDFADASLVVAAEQLRTTRVFTLDRSDFATYRARIGRSHRSFKVVGA